MKITQRQLRHLIREELELDQASNPLEGEYAGYIMAYDTRFDKKYVKTIFRKAYDLIRSTNSDIISPEMQKDLVLISEQLWRGYNDPDQMSQSIEGRVYQLFKDIDVEYYREVYNDKIRNRQSTASNVTSIATALNHILTDTGLTDYGRPERVEFLKKLYAQSLNIHISSLKEKLTALAEEDIIELKQANHALIAILNYYPRVNKDYKENITNMMKGGGGIMQAGSLLDSLY